MTCPGCANLSVFQDTVLVDDMPLRAVCRQCGYEVPIHKGNERRFRILPKLNPAIKAVNHWNLVPGLESQPAPVPVMEGKERQVEKSFRQQTLEVSSMFLAALQGASEMRANVERLVMAITEDMERSMGEARCIESWNPKLLFQFMMAPLGSLDANCLDPSIRLRSKFIIAPNFYPRLHGFPVAMQGGFYVQAVTPYSQLAFPLETHLLDSLQIEAPTKLRILGDKVVGDGLHREWMHVEGAVPDEDHGLNSPSLAIEDRRLVRTWLTKQGSRGWYAMDLAKLFFPYHAGMLESDCNIEAVLELQKEFTCTGRMVVCWQDVPLARQAVAILGHGMRHAKLILRNGAPVDWHHGFKLEYSDKRLFVEESCDMDRVRHHLTENTIGLLIVDATDSMPPLEFWHELHRYTGPLIVILREPFLDTFDENEYAAAVYSLVHTVSAIADTREWRKAWRAYEQSPPDAVRRALDAMRIKWGRRD